MRVERFGVKLATIDDQYSVSVYILGLLQHCKASEGVVPFFREIIYIFF